MANVTPDCCIDCKGLLPEGTEPCPSCGRLVCEKCFDGTEGMCLACPKRARDKSVFTHEGQPIEIPGLAEIPQFMCDDEAEDLAQPVTYELLAKKIVESETRMRYDQMMKRKAFEERVQAEISARYQKELDQIRAQIADLLVNPMEVTP